MNITKQIVVDPKFAGLIIGKAGKQVISIAITSGKGTRIQHDNNRKGTFNIIANSHKSIDKAVKQIFALIQSAQSAQSAQSTQSIKKPYNGRTSQLVRKDKQIKSINIGPIGPIGPVSNQMNISIEKVTGYKWLPGKHWGDDND
jgi:hypothetical protein